MSKKYKYPEFTPVIMKVAEGRASFTKIVNGVGKTTKSYIIQKRNLSKSVIIDIETAKKYLPKEYWQKSTKKETAGAKFVREGRIIRKEIAKWSKGMPKENLSEKIDEIVYGI